MPPKQSRKSAAPPQAPVTYLDALFPTWEDAKRGGRDKPDAGKPLLQYLYCAQTWRAARLAQLQVELAHCC